MVRLLNTAAGDISIICQSVRISFCLFLALSSLPVRNLSLLHHKPCLHSLNHRNLLNYKEGFPEKLHFRYVENLIWSTCLVWAVRDQMEIIILGCGGGVYFKTFQHLLQMWRQKNISYRHSTTSSFTLHPTKIGNKHVQWNIFGNRDIKKDFYSLWKIHLLPAKLKQNSLLLL